MNREIPIFFTIDNAYAPFLAVALTSAIENSSEENSYRAIVLHQGVSDENIAKISSLAKPNFKIDFIEMKSGLEAITDRMSNRLRCDYFTLTIYFRLFIPRMFPEYDKGIYIDSDVVVPHDLAELYNTDIGDNFIGACNDMSIVDTPPLVSYVENAVGIKMSEYINSGVLLMNLKKLREVNLDKRFLELLNEYHFDCIAPDQDYLNAMCNGKIHYLDTAWDAMPNEAKSENPNPCIIHYNLFSKPWCYDGVQYAEQFWHYAANSGYSDEIKAYKAAYSDEQKANDSRCMQLLCDRGVEICENDITFKKLYESGVKIRL